MQNKMEVKNNIILNIPEDCCDNAPKKRIIRDFIIAFYKKEWDIVNGGLEKEFEFRIIGNRIILDKEGLRRYLEESVVLELTIEEVLTHGKFGASNGFIKSNNEKIAFAYFFEFRSAGKNSIKTISEYKIPIY
jgi:hypothetical protein